MEEDKPHVPLHNGSMNVFTKAFEYDKVWYPPLVLPNTLENLKFFEVRKDDLILATFPKAGTHWMMELILLIEQDGYPENLKRGRDPVLNTDFIFRAAPDFKQSGADLLVTRSSPRFYRTHLPSKHLPAQVWTKKPKVVYVTREPKDACASLYRWFNSNPANPNEVPWKDVFDNFISEKALFGNWCDHALGYWKHRYDGHVFFITFEEMEQDIRSVTKRLAGFLGKAISEGGMERIAKLSSLDEMKRTYAKLGEESENGKIFTKCYGLMPYLQKGVSGSWKEVFTEEQKKQMEKVMKKRLLGTGLDVYYPL